MLGRRLDRYVTSFFVWHFVLCLVAVLGLYVVVDTFTELNEFTQRGGTLKQIQMIARYYLYQIPVLVSQFLPIITLLAGIIAMARLATYNELNAMKAAGISMRRAVAPVLLCTLGIAALAAANQELLLPRIEQGLRNVEFESKRSDISTNLWVYDEETGTTIEAEELDTSVEGRELRRIEAVADPEFGPDGEVLPQATIQAEKAVWADAWLFLFDGHVTDAAGKTHPFATRVLRTAAKAALFDPESRPASRLSDGTPAHLIRARTDLPVLRFVSPQASEAEMHRDPLGNRSLSVQFAEVALIARYRLITNGHITGSYAGEQTRPPLSVQVALWQDGQWLGRAQTYVEATDAQDRAQRHVLVYDGDPLPINGKPADLVKRKVDPALKSLGYLVRKVRRNPKNYRLRQRIFVLLHARLAFPLANFVLLLIAIPLLFQQEGGKSTWVGVGMALVVALGFYFFSYFCRFVGQDPQGVFAGIPALAAWLPIGIFGLSGGILFANMNT